MHEETHPLKAYRLENKLSLEALAEKAETTKSTLSRIENRRIKPSLDLIARLMKATAGAVSADDMIRSGAKCS